MSASRGSRYPVPSNRHQIWLYLPTSMMQALTNQARLHEQTTEQQMYASSHLDIVWHTYHASFSMPPILPMYYNMILNNRQRSLLGLVFGYDRNGYPLCAWNYLPCVSIFTPFTCTLSLWRTSLPWLNMSARNSNYWARIIGLRCLYMVTVVFWFLKFKLVALA